MCKNINMLTIIYFSLYALLFFSCDNPTNTNNDYHKTVEFNGSVTLLSETGSKFTDHSNVEIKLENSDKSTITNSNGNWTITDEFLFGAPYILTFQLSKEHFGLTKIKNSIVVKNEDNKFSLENTELIQIPTFTVTNLTAEVRKDSVSNNYFIDLSCEIGDIKDKSKEYKLLICYDTIVDVNINLNSTYNIERIFKGNKVTYNDSLLYLILPWTQDIPSGSDLYFCIYPASWHWYKSGYYDYNTSTRIYKSIGIPSNVVSVKVP